MEKSISIANPGTTFQNKSIALYNNAFVHPTFKLDRVVVHELAHVIYLNFSNKEKESYIKSLDWEEDLEKSFRKGEFLSTDAKGSIEEDFATNIEFYLLETEKLKKQIPQAYKWINNKFSNNFKMKESCDE